MKRLICASGALALATVPALAGERYDRKLEEAAMQIVAGKIGEIRGGFSYGQEPQFVVAQDALLPDAGQAQAPGLSPSIVAPAARPNS